MRETFRGDGGALPRATAELPDRFLRPGRESRSTRRHASLSWELAEWLDERITADERRAVDDAFEAAVAALDDELDHEPPHTLALLAGALNARRARALFACLSDAVFPPGAPRCA